MNLREYVTEKLNADACYDGLCWPDTCGCTATDDDLMPCKEPNIECEPGHIRFCHACPYVVAGCEMRESGLAATQCVYPGRRPLKETR